jgi:hypothetical protein
MTAARGADTGVAGQLSRGATKRKRFYTVFQRRGEDVLVIESPPLLLVDGKQVPYCVNS